MRGLLVCEQPHELLVLEADQIEIEIIVLKSTQLEPQEFFVPAGVFNY